MKIELQRIKIRDLFNGYKDSEEEGVVGWGGRLNIRPKYQREFVYKDKQRDAVIDTVANRDTVSISVSERRLKKTGPIHLDKSREVCSFR